VASNRALAAREYWQGLPLPPYPPLCHLPKIIAHARQKKYAGRHLRRVVGASIPAKLSTATHEALGAVVQ
jgi:hypothetical protein